MTMSQDMWLDEPDVEPTEEERYERWLKFSSGVRLNVANRPFRFKSIHIPGPNDWVRRIVPGLIKQEMFGVQPMPDPTSLIFAMRLDLSAMPHFGGKIEPV
jgi:hypothetical protein